MKLTYYLLIGAILCGLFTYKRQNIYILLALTACAALYEQMLLPLGTFILFILAALSWLYFNKIKNVSLKLGLFILISGLLVGLVLHEMPGFNNPVLLKQVKVGISRHYFSLYLNLDKVMAALILYATSPLIYEKSFTLKAAKQSLKIALWCIITLVLPAVAIKYIKLDLKLPDIFPLWLGHNLFLVCFSEEVIFRGFIQNNLKKYLAKMHYLFPLILTSLIFGLVHYKQGMIYIGFATICGLFYGYAYEKTQRIFGAILVHFLFNLSHLLIFTYPH